MPGRNGEETRPAPFAGEGRRPSLRSGLQRLPAGGRGGGGRASRPISALGGNRAPLRGPQTARGALGAGLGNPAPALEAAPGRAGGGGPLAPRPPSNVTARPDCGLRSPPGQGGLCADAADPKSLPADSPRRRGPDGVGTGSSGAGGQVGLRGAEPSGGRPRWKPSAPDRVFHSPPRVARVTAIPRQGH